MLRFLFVLILFAVATYLLIRVFQQRGLMPERPNLPKRQAPKKMIAPDDDEDFLRDLDRKRRDPEDPDAGP
ncbi:MAG: hypothetical protein OSB43_14780 [Nocardioides sp.]|uniref:hypothetical protein n=1 Tax=Nocardioides sp. TaxID=35761 RepID=UPI00239B5BAA|nr:hypothetical protein [Nocardioides sp.]MDE0777539.1 hypothetical protein [Nocardioides sp.]